MLHNYKIGGRWGKGWQRHGLVARLINKAINYQVENMQNKPWEGRYVTFLSSPQAHGKQTSLPLWTPD